MMKVKLIFLLILSSAAVFAQDPRIEREIKARIGKSRLRTIALEKAVNASPASKALAEKVFVADSSASDKAIIEAGETGDKSVMPLLKVLADDGDVYAQAALARFGDEEYLTRIIALTDKKQDVLERQRSVPKLIIFNHKRAWKRLYELLDDTEMPKIDSHDEIISSTADVVIDRLSQTVKNPPRLPNGRIDETVPTWKAWFSRNKHLIE